MKTGGGCLLGEVPLCFEDALPAIPLPHRGGEKGQGSALEGRTERAQGVSAPGRAWPEDIPLPQQPPPEWGLGTPTHQ